MRENNRNIINMANMATMQTWQSAKLGQRARFRVAEKPVMAPSRTRVITRANHKGGSSRRDQRARSVMEPMTEGWTEALSVVGKLKQRKDRESVTTLDLSLGEEECAKVMRKAAERGVGFFFLKGHDISQELIDDVLDANSRFFDLDPYIKDRFRVKSPFQEPLGYKDSQKDGITADKESQSAPCFREYLNVGRRRNVDDIHRENGTKNYQQQDTYGEEEGQRLVWLDESCDLALARSSSLVVDDIKHKCEEYYEEAFKLSRKVHRIVALSLGLPADDFDRHFMRPLDFMLLNNYPKEKRDPTKGLLGLGAHCDFAFTTLLLTDGTKGLQVCKDKTKTAQEREWVDVPTHEPGTFVINFGDALETLSNGKCISVMHRVANTSNKKRKSVAFFCEPSADAKIVPVVQPGEKQKYETIETYAKYMGRKFASIGQDNYKT